MSNCCAVCCYCDKDIAFQEYSPPEICPHCNKKLEWDWYEDYDFEPSYFSTKIEDYTAFKQWGKLEVFAEGQEVIKNGVKGIVKAIVFARCYVVQWENGEENHVYHHEVEGIKL